VSDFDRRYSDAQRDALVEAYVDRGVRPARRVAELAAAGELTHDGEPVERFTVPASTVRSLARDARRHRHSTAALDSLSPRDAVERLRLRLIRAIDRELNRVERRQRAGEPVKGEELRQLARAQRELTQIPGLRDPLPPAPGAKVNGVREGGETRGGLAGPMMRDLRSTGGGRPFMPAPSPPVAPPLEAPAAAAPELGDDSPGALVSEQIARLQSAAAEETAELPAPPPARHAGAGDEAAARRPILEPDGFDHSRCPPEDTSSITGIDR
jgi:hypothetical protein